MARKPKRKSSGKKAAAEKILRELQDAKKSDDAPKGLDDLIKSIQNEVKREEKKKKEINAIVKSVTDKKEKEAEPKKEDIDPRILEILGLEDYEAELDYDEYYTLLKEAMVSSRMGGGTEEKEGDTELLKKELKKARDNKGKGSFKPNTKKKVRTSNFVGKSDNQSTDVKKVQLDKLLPPVSSAVKKDEESDEEVKAEVKEDTQEQLIPLSKSLTGIEESLKEILKLNEERLDLEKQAAKDLETKEENEAFKKKEAELEGKKTGKNFDKIGKAVKPALSIFDMIKNFITNVLLGAVVNFILDFIKDPGKYLRPIYDFVNGIIDGINNSLEWILDNIIMAPINWYVDYMNLLVGGIEAAINQVTGLIPGLPDVQLPRAQKPNLDLPDIPKIPYPDWMVQQQEGGGQVIDIKNLTFAGGGAIDKNSGLTIKGLGKDTQLIAAQPGEIMMSKKAVNAYGADNLLAANAAAGGTNKPKFGKIQGFQGGGQVGKLVIGAGHAPSEDNAMKGIALGSDGLAVQGTQDFKTGVPEWRATRHLVKTLQRIVGNNPALSSKISFENITAERGDKGLRGVPSRVEQQSGTQYVDIHFDARGGRAGVLNPESNRVSSIDRAMAAVFGTYPGIKPSEKGVTAAGGTILEVAAIDDPSIGMFLGEVKKGTFGKESFALANKVLNSMLPGLSGAAVQPQQQPENLIPGQNGVPVAPILPPPPGQIAPTINNGQVIQSPGAVTIPGPPGGGGGGGQTVVAPTPTAVGSQMNSSSGANQNKVPGFSAEDVNNFDLIVVKSIYNIVG